MFILKLLIFLIGFQCLNALRCYTCSYVQSTLSKACINDPEQVDGQKITNCNKKYCIIQRQELVNPPGVVNSFLRGCEDSPMNEVFEDPTFKTYYRSCNTDLCNVGNGLSSGGFGANADGSGIRQNLVVPGRTGSGNSLIINPIIFLSMMLLFKFIF